MHPNRVMLTLAMTVAFAGGNMVPTALAEVPTEPTASCYEQIRPLDIALQPGGVLNGQMIAGKNAAPVQQNIVLHDANGPLAEARLDDSGRFAFGNVSGGVYRLACGDDCRVVRAWAPGTAPPGADSCLRYTREATVRGQYQPPAILNAMARGIKHGATKPLVVGSVLAVAVGVPVIVHNLDQDDHS